MQIFIYVSLCICESCGPWDPGFLEGVREANLINIEILKSIDITRRRRAIMTWIVPTNLLRPDIPRSRVLYHYYGFNFMYVTYIFYIKLLFQILIIIITELMTRLLQE